MPKKYRDILITLLVVVSLFGITFFVVDRNSSLGRQEAINKPLILTSIYPLFGVAEKIAGRDADVESIVPAGTSSSDYIPDAKTEQKIQEADLFIYYGIEIDDWASQAVTRIPEGSKVKTLRITDDLDLVKGIQESLNKITKSEDPDQAEENTEANLQNSSFSYFWLDLDLYKLQLEVVEKAVIGIDPEKKNNYENRSDSYLNRLNKFKEDMEEGFAGCKLKNFYTDNTTVFTFIENDYDLKAKPLPELDLTTPDPKSSTEEDSLTPGEKQLQKAFEELDSRYYLATNPVSSQLETSLRKVGVRVLEMSDILNLKASELRIGEDYITLMRQNYENLQIALRCGEGENTNKSASSS